MTQQRSRFGFQTRPPLWLGFVVVLSIVAGGFGYRFSVHVSKFHADCEQMIQHHREIPLRVNRGARFSVPGVPGCEIERNRMVCTGTRSALEGWYLQSPPTGSQFASIMFMDRSMFGVQSCWVFSSGYYRAHDW